MLRIAIRDLQDFIVADGETLTTTSLQLAAVFGKRHADVIRAIRNLEEQIPPDEFERNFALIQINSNLGMGRTRKDPAYRITRDGFTLLAMGFHGKRALAFKLAYIRAFNAMAALIQKQHERLQYLFFQKELEVKDRRKNASAAGRELNSWKQEKSLLEAELVAIYDKMQPRLPLETWDLIR